MEGGTESRVRVFLPEHERDQNMFRCQRKKQQGKGGRGQVRETGGRRSRSTGVGTDGLREEGQVCVRGEERREWPWVRVGFYGPRTLKKFSQMTAACACHLPGACSCLSVDG